MPIDPTKRDPNGRLYFIRADGGKVHCDLLECAGMTLHAAISSARKNQKNVLGINGEAYSLLEQWEIDVFRKEMEKDEAGVFVCDHEMWQVLKASDLPLAATCESA